MTTAHQSTKPTTQQLLHELIQDSDSEFSEIDSDNDTFNDGGVYLDNDVEIISYGDLSNERSEIWKRQNDFDNYFPLWCPAYSKKPGSVLPPDMNVETARPIDYFCLLFPEEAFQLMSNMTNKYALDFFDDPSGLLPKSRYNKWYECSANEMKAFVGIQIAMSLCFKPKISSYWANSGITMTPSFSDVMSRNRYQLLCSFLHFCDNSIRIPRGEEGYDPLHKIRPFINILKPLSSQYYNPQRELSIDMSMRKSKGKTYFRQYIPNKLNRWGIKIWGLCESTTGYLLNWIIYTGRERDMINAGIGHYVVMSLMDGYLNKGHYLYLDDSYTSIELFSALKELKTGSCGMIRANKAGFPQELHSANLKLRKGDDPVYYRHEDFLVCAWQDTTRLNFLSTIDNNENTEMQIRTKGTATTDFKGFQKPKMACTYNRFISGIDLFDKKCSVYPYPHKCSKWYQAVFHFLKDAALINSFIIYQAANPASKMDFLTFKSEVAESLVSSIPAAQYTRKGRRSMGIEGEMPERLIARHFPMTFPDPKYKPDCIVCSNSQRNPKRKQTRHGCRDCKDKRGKNLPMCSPDCFTVYHTVKQFRY